MTSATINNWCYSFDDDRSPPVTKKAAKPLDHVVAEPAPAKRHCPYCHTLVAVGNGTAICGDEKCAKKHQRDKDIQRLDLAHQRCGGGLVQQGKNRQ
jgi:hypothetical protein